MIFGLRSTFVLLFVFSLSVNVSTEKAAAQGPILKKLRSFNGGRPLLPFVSEPKPIKPPSSAKEPTLAKKPEAASGKSAGSRTPTPATKKQPTLVKKPTLAKESTNGAREPLAEPPKKVDQTLAAKGFGMWIQESRDRFYISQVDPRGNANAAGLRRGDLIVNVGGAPLKVIEEYAAIAKAMRAGDRVEFEVSRRGSKPAKIPLQFGIAPPVKQPPIDDKNEEIRVPVSTTPTVRQPPRYKPDANSGLKSVYEGSGTPSSVFEPTPARRPNVESLEVDLPSLE